MTGHGAAGLRRTYLNLGLGELAAVVVFVVVRPVVAGRLGDDGGPTLWWAMTPLLVVLLQGSAYWLAARAWLPGALPGAARPGRSWPGTRRPGMPRPVALTFRAFRLLDPVLLAVCFAGLLLSGADGGALVVCLLVWAFGVLEYVNYFVVRLSYPVAQWSALVGRRRTPALVRDVARVLGAPAATGVVHPGADGAVHPGSDAGGGVRR